MPNKYMIIWNKLIEQKYSYKSIGSVWEKAYNWHMVWTSKERESYWDFNGIFNGIKRGINMLKRYWYFDWIWSRCISGKIVAYHVFAVHHDTERSLILILLSCRCDNCCNVDWRWADVSVIGDFCCSDLFCMLKYLLFTWCLINHPFKKTQTIFDQWW